MLKCLLAVNSVSSLRRELVLKNENSLILATSWPFWVTLNSRSSLCCSTFNDLYLGTRKCAWENGERVHTARKWRRGHICSLPHFGPIFTYEYVRALYICNRKNVSGRPGGRRIFTLQDHFLKAKVDRPYRNVMLHSLEVFRWSTGDYFNKGKGGLDIINISRSMRHKTFFLCRAELVALLQLHSWNVRGKVGPKIMQCNESWACWAKRRKHRNQWCFLQVKRAFCWMP